MITHSVVMATPRSGSRHAGRRYCAVHGQDGRNSGADRGRGCSCRRRRTGTPPSTSWPGPSPRWTPRWRRDARSVWVGETVGRSARPGRLRGLLLPRRTGRPDGRDPPRGVRRRRSSAGTVDAGQDRDRRRRALPRSGGPESRRRLRPGRRRRPAGRGARGRAGPCWRTTIRPSTVGSTTSTTPSTGRRPVQAGGVPLVVFLQDQGPDWTGLLEVCARAADAVVVHGGPDGVREARRCWAGPVPSVTGRVRGPWCSAACPPAAGGGRGAGRRPVGGRRRLPGRGAGAVGRPGRLSADLGLVTPADPTGWPAVRPRRSTASRPCRPGPRT